MTSEPVTITADGTDGSDGTDGVDVEQLVSELEGARVQIANLERALVTSRAIGAAVGVVMATEKITYDAAFQMLSQHSQRRNLKLRELAERVLLTGAL